ncbi:unnamed protein product [Gulo gulo]|uniref:Uncharacterized protein n=1 Tax=Gulo gulo TaxID=48420 RepID=A0A9X9LCY0_GULGU|nr:unnamed protein product [Gulo gulo]
MSSFAIPKYVHSVPALDPSCISHPSLHRVQRWERRKKLWGPSQLNRHAPLQLPRLPHMVVRVEGSPFQRGTLPEGTTLPAAGSCFQTQAAFPWRGPGLQTVGPLTRGIPNPHIPSQPPAGCWRLRERARGCTLARQPSAALTTCAARRDFPLGPALGTATGSRAEAGRGATSRAPAHLPQNRSQPARAAAGPVPAHTRTHTRAPRTHRHSLPSVLLSSALCRCGYWSASLRRAACAHTMKAFMGRFT